MKKTIVFFPCQSSGEIAIQLSGLEIMNDDPKSANIVYGKVLEDQGGSKLQALARNSS